MIALIPHIVRRPEYTAENLRGIAVGNQQTVNLNYGRRKRMPSTPAAAPQEAGPAARRPAAPPAPVAATHPARAAGASAPALPPATAPPPAPPATGPAGHRSACAPLRPAAPRRRPPTPKPAGNAVVRFLSPAGRDRTAGRQLDGDPHHGERDRCRLRADASHVRPQGAPAERRRPRRFLLQRRQAVPVFTKNIQNDAGAATIQTQPPARMLPASPVPASLITLIFQAVAKGRPPVTVPNLTHAQLAGAGSRCLQRAAARQRSSKVVCGARIKED